MMTGQEAYAMLDRGRDWIGPGFQSKLGRIFFDSSMQAGTGIFYPGMKYSKIGVQAYTDEPDRRFTDAYVAESVIALFHETYGHALQEGYLFREKTDETTAVLAFNAYACSGSPAYYGVGYRERKLPFQRREKEANTLEGNMKEFVKNRYYHQPHEVAATYAGVKMGYEFLCDEWGPERAEKAICHAMNRDAAMSLGICCNLPLKSPCRSMDDVTKAFEEEFPKCVFRNRDYDPSEDFDPKTKQWGPFVEWSHLTGRSDFLTKSQKHMTGFQQDLIQVQARVLVDHVKRKNLPKCFHDFYFDDMGIMNFGAESLLDKTSKEIKANNKQAKPVRVKPSLSYLDEAMAEVRSLEPAWAEEPDNPLYQPDYC